MRIQVTGPGRKGTLEEGVGKLTCSQAKGYESKMLKVLFDEIRENMGYWTALMWAAQQGKLTKEEDEVLWKVIERVKKDWLKYTGEA